MIAALLLVLGAVAPRCYPPPVAAPVAVPYLQPACEYCPGHRGLEYHLAEGSAVRAVSSGVVTFSGVVAGTRYVVVLQPDGLRATYGQLSAVVPSRGAVIAAGQLVGSSSERLYFGLRDAGNTPVDPTPLLGTLIGRARLVPSDGGASRPGAPPRLQCGPAVSPIWAA